MTDAEASLWRELKLLLRVAAAIFGEPASLLEEGAVARREGLAIRAWLAALEAIARALLTIMAARLPKPLPRPRSARSATARPIRVAPRSDFPSPAEPPSSERWAGVAFRTLPSEPRSRSGGGGGPYRLLLSRPLAFRFEALIRVAEAPEPYARRLATRLHANPAIAARVLRPAAARGGRPSPYEDLVEGAFSHAAEAARAFAPNTG